MHRRQFCLEKSLKCKWLKAVFVCAYPLEIFSRHLLLAASSSCAGWTVFCPMVAAFSLSCCSGSSSLLYVLASGHMLLPTSFNSEQMEEKMDYRFFPQPSKSCQAYCRNICFSVNLRHHALHLTCAEPLATVTGVYQRTANTCHSFQ